MLKAGSKLDIVLVKREQMFEGVIENGYSNQAGARMAQPNVF